MTGLEIVGASAIYIVCLILAGYAAAAISAFLNRKGGLESIIWVVLPAFIIWFAGAVVGLVLFGRMLA